MKEKIIFTIFTAGTIIVGMCVVFAFIIPWFYGAMRLVLKIIGVE